MENPTQILHIYKPLYISLEYINHISYPLLNYTFTVLSKAAEFFPGRSDNSQEIVGSLYVI